ncbi:unnamed protein product [Nezara viridula]|uniref:Conserved oligomeric Golgi complex subunit 8 n=1 Tax=Nezara viridula TaxID=85310 RepID=A0A9P0HN57_NEZVI|nr:unnamed protein product [Nezara viridula]
MVKPRFLTVVWKEIGEFFRRRLGGTEMDLRSEGDSIRMAFVFSIFNEDLCGFNIPFYPLARLTNGILSCLNNLRHGAPLALAQPVTSLVEETLFLASQHISNFHKKEQQALGKVEMEMLFKLVLCFSDQMLPHLQTCIHTVYPPAEIAQYLSLSVSKLQSQGLTYLDFEKILGPIKHLQIPKLEKPLTEEIKQPETNVITNIVC